MENKLSFECSVPVERDLYLDLAAKEYNRKLKLELINVRESRKDFYTRLFHLDIFTQTYFIILWTNMIDRMNHKVREHLIPGKFNGI